MTPVMGCTEFSVGTVRSATSERVRMSATAATAKVHGFMIDCGLGFSVRHIHSRTPGVIIGSDNSRPSQGPVLLEGLGQHISSHLSDMHYRICRESLYRRPSKYFRNRQWNLR